MSARDYVEALIEQGWVEVDLDESWVAAYRIVAQDRQPVVAELRIFPSAGPRPGPGRWNQDLRGPDALVPPGGLTARLARQARLGEHFSAGMQIMRWLNERGGSDWRADAEWTAEPPPDLFPGAPGDAEWTGVAAFTPPAADPAKRPGGGKRIARDVRLAEIASQYVEAVNRGSRKPVEDVALACGKSVDAVRMMIYRARPRLLTYPPARDRGMGFGGGQKGGRLTPLCLKLLNESKSRRASSTPPKKGSRK